MKAYLKCKKVETAIKRAKNFLTKKPLCENFGQQEVREIEEKFIDISSYTDEMNHRRNLIGLFDSWCMTYTGTSNGRRSRI